MMSTKNILVSIYFGINALMVWPVFASQLLIKNVTLISAERAQPLEHANVRIVDGKIIEVSQTGLYEDPGLSALTSQIDATGQFLIPGLMDSHVHVSNMPGLLLDKNSPTELQDLHREFIQQQPRSYLYFGVTQLLDPAQFEDGLIAFNASLIKPDLFHCGAISVLDGYPTMFANAESKIQIYKNLVLEQKDQSKNISGFDYQSHSPEAVVARIADEGAICIKVFIEDGFGLNNQWPILSQNLLTRLQRTARKHGLIMMAHANAIDMQQIVLNNSIDVIAHGMWNWNQFDGKQGLPDQIKLVLDEIIKQNTVFQPTLNVMDGLKGVTVPDILTKPLYSKVISKSAMHWYNSDEGLWFRNEMLNGFAGLSIEAIHSKQDTLISQGERVVQYLNNQGHPMILASDTPSSPTFAAQPGYSTFMELQHLAKVGVSLKNIFAAATINNAKAFGLDKQYGTVEPDKIANLLLLDANPLESIAAYNQIDKIILKGEVIDRESLAVK